MRITETKARESERMGLVKILRTILLEAVKTNAVKSSKKQISTQTNGRDVESATDQPKMTCRINKMLRERLKKRVGDTKNSRGGWETMEIDGAIALPGWGNRFSPNSGHGLNDVIEIGFGCFGILSSEQSQGGFFQAINGFNHSGDGNVQGIVHFFNPN